MKYFCLFFIMISNTWASYDLEGELATLVTSGNTQFETYQLKEQQSYQWQRNTLTQKGNYTYGESEEVRSAENWTISLRYDRSVSERWSVFVAEELESNRFAGFRRRYNSDAGFQYLLSKTDRQTTSGEVSYRYSIEKRTNPSLPRLYSSKARFFLQSKVKINQNADSILGAEYVPNFSQSDQYLMNLIGDFRTTITEKFSLKLSYFWRYDSEPAPGNAKHDTELKAALVVQI